MMQLPVVVVGVVLAISGYGRPSYGFGGPDANAGYGSANAGYSCGSNSGYIGGQSPGYQGNISSGSFDHQMQPRAGPAYSGYGRPSYGFGLPDANAGYGSANARYSCGSNSGYIGGQSPGYGLSVGYGSNVSAPNQSATGASGYGYGYDTNPGECRAAAGRFGPVDATSGDPGGGYNGPTGHSSAAWRRSDS